LPNAKEYQTGTMCGHPRPVPGVPHCGREHRRSRATSLAPNGLCPAFISNTRMTRRTCPDAFSPPHPSPAVLRDRLRHMATPTAIADHEKLYNLLPFYSAPGRAAARCPSPPRPSQVRGPTPPGPPAPLAGTSRAAKQAPRKAPPPARRVAIQAGTPQHQPPRGGSQARPSVSAFGAGVPVPAWETGKAHPCAGFPSVPGNVPPTQDARSAAITPSPPGPTHVPLQPATSASPNAGQ